MVWKAYTGTTLSYDFAKVLPQDDPDYLFYESFKKQFGEDGSVMVLGISDKDLYRVERFRRWYQLSDEISRIHGIEAVISTARLYTLMRNDSLQKFDLKSLPRQMPSTQDETDSLKAMLDRLPFYKGFIHNPETGASLMAITFDKALLNTRERFTIIDRIEELALNYEKESGSKVHISGLPFIRTAITGKVVEEMRLFMILAVLVTALVLFVFFRSFQVVFFSIVVVAVGVVWSLGFMALFGFKITALSGLIPPLLIVIGIPNSILMLNKYHSEYVRHGGKAKGLARMVQRIGFTTLLANVTTAIGFFVFYFTSSRLLMEFGLIASINVMATWLISLFLIPIMFSFLPPPAVKHTRHLQAPRLNRLLERIDRWVHHHHRIVYGTVIVIVLISIYGTTKLTSVGYVVDDLPKDDPVYIDMKFFEKNFKGVLPLEITVDMREEGAVLRSANLQKLNRLQKMLTAYPELSRPISVVDGIKFSYQAYRDLDPKFYILPGSLDLAEMSAFANADSGNKQQMFRSFIDSTRRTARMSVQMADVGSVRMESLIAELKPRIDSVFPPDQYTTQITGNSLIFLRGNDYLFKGLAESIILAIVLISLIMITLFMSVRMILISILPSLIPLVMTAGLMGFFQIPLKPSTILIFSIAFGIASDQTIYFLTRYRQEMRMHPVISISRAVSLTIRETGVSMVYTAVILFAGFFIFSASSFGGTASLGKLISFTLLVAMCANLVLLPAFLVSLERRLTTKAFLKEPLFETDKEQDDIDIEELDLRQSPDSKENS